MIANWLHFRGVEVYDPCDKPIDIGIEDMEHIKLRKQWKADGEFDDVCREMKIVRAADLRMVDSVDFLIVNLDMEVHACGTYEELFWANREKKPIVVHIEQGKNQTPDWLLGAIPHQMIFSTWPQVHQYLDRIDTNKKIETFRRWMFFDHNKTYRDQITSYVTEYKRLARQYGKDSFQAKRFKLRYKDHPRFLERIK